MATRNLTEELIYSCKEGIASDMARFGAAWERIGLIPGTGGTYLLPRIIALDNAFEFCFTG